MYLVLVPSTYNSRLDSPADSWSELMHMILVLVLPHGPSPSPGDALVDPASLCKARPCRPLAPTNIAVVVVGAAKNASALRTPPIAAIVTATAPLIPKHRGTLPATTGPDCC